jgi:hypothetical protein
VVHCRLSPKAAARRSQVPYVVSSVCKFVTKERWCGEIRSTPLRFGRALTRPRTQNANLALFPPSRLIIIILPPCSFSRSRHTHRPAFLAIIHVWSAPARPGYFGVDSELELRHPQRRTDGRRPDCSKLPHPLAPRGAHAYEGARRRPASSLMAFATTTT